MILTFSTILFKLFFATLIDRHRAYRSFFCLFLTTALIGYGSFGVIPFFINQNADSEDLNMPFWVLICFMTTTATLAMSGITCLSDSFAMHSCQRHNISFGRIRVWGTIGWACGSLILMVINETRMLPFLVPGIFMCIILIFLDNMLAIVWPDHDDFKLSRDPTATVAGSDFSTQERRPVVSKSTRQSIEPIEVRSHASSLDSDVSSIRVQWLLFKEVARRRPSLFHYLFLFTSSGMLISLQWVYLFKFFEEIYKGEFNFVSTASMLSQALLGELPFFILSDYIVKTIGRAHTLSLSLAAIGVRYLMYEYLLRNSSSYFVILTESLAGPCFGLFYVVLTDVGLDYSHCDDAIEQIIADGHMDDNPNKVDKLRKSLIVTMQGLMSSCYEGLGAGIGSFLGGYIIQRYSFHTLWIASSIFAISLSLGNSLAHLLKLVPS